MQRESSLAMPRAALPRSEKPSGYFSPFSGKGNTWCVNLLFPTPTEEINLKQNSNMFVRNNYIWNKRTFAM